MCASIIACTRNPSTTRGQSTADDLAVLPWDSIVTRARGSTVVWRMWRGDPSINKYVDGWVAPRLRERFDITLKAVEGQGPQMVNDLVIEREAGRAKGTASLLWINGETFSNLKRERLIAGRWASRLPGAQYVDSASPIIMRDFEQTLSGFESPWGRVQFAMIYDSVRTPHPPQSFAELASWIRAHPGRFTFDQGFTGVTFLKMLMYAKGGGASSFSGGFDSTHYIRTRDSMFAWIDSLRPMFWRGGATFPLDVPAMHRLFANGEIEFSMSNNQNDVVTKAREDIIPASSRAVLLRDGTIANAHYLGIPWNAPAPAAAMVVADFLLSPEAQLEKQKPGVWADGTVLDMKKIPSEWRDRFERLAIDNRQLPKDSLARYAVPEVSPRYHEHLAADWRAHAREPAASPTR